MLLFTLEGSKTSAPINSSTLLYSYFRRFIRSVLPEEKMRFTAEEAKGVKSRSHSSQHALSELVKNEKQPFCEQERQSSGVSEFLRELCIEKSFAKSFFENFTFSEF